MGASETVNPGAWKRDSFAGVADYAVELTPRDREEILAALRRLRIGGRLTPADALTRSDFPFGALGERLGGAYEDVRSGRGFVLVRGLPVEGLTVDEFIAGVWGVGTWFGSPLSQNAQGELIGHVLDATDEDATPRMYRSNLELRPAHRLDRHDFARVLAEGGERRGERPDQRAYGARRDQAARARTARAALPRLSPPSPRRGGARTRSPVNALQGPRFLDHDNQLSCRYQRSGIAAAHRERGVALTEQDLAAMDLFDEIAKAPEHRLASSSSAAT